MTKVEITEAMSKEITKAFSARSCLVEILDYFQNNKSLSKDKFWKLLKIGSSKTDRYFEKSSQSKPKEKSE